MHLIAILRRYHSGKRLLIIDRILVVSERERVLVVWLWDLAVLRRGIHLALSLNLSS
jgi:hypothetical protein